MARRGLLSIHVLDEDEKVQSEQLGGHEALTDQIRSKWIAVLRQVQGSLLHCTRWHLENSTSRPQSTCSLKQFHESESWTERPTHGSRVPPVLAVLS